MLGDRFLTGSGDERQDKLQRVTVPGQVDWADIDGPHHDKHCASCAHRVKGRRCALFLQIMRARLNQPNFAGPKIANGARACRKYQASTHGDASYFVRSPSSSSSSSMEGDADMASITNRFGKRMYLSRADVQNGDLILQIDHVEFDVQVGKELKDVVHFVTGEKLVLNPTNALAMAALHGDESDGWAGKWITLFFDPDVEYDGKREGGLRVRPEVPREDTDGFRLKQRSSMDDEIPF
jgi:hypothetical protein